MSSFLLKMYFHFKEVTFDKTKVLKKKKLIHKQSQQDNICKIMKTLTQCLYNHR